jgi:integrase
MPTIQRRSTGTWSARVRRTGFPAQSKTFHLKADAIAWARSVEREMDVGSFIDPNDAQKTTFTEVAARYEREVVPRLRGKVQTGYVLKRLQETFGSHSLAAITPPMLAAYRDDRLKSVSAQTVVHELGLISRIYKAAMLDWGVSIPKGNPCQLVRKPKLANERQRRLEPGEKELLLAALKECKVCAHYTAAMLAIETAARQSELVALQWEDIDLDARVARLRGIGGGVTKNGDAWRDIPLTRAAVALLEGLAGERKGQILKISQNALQIGWERAVKRARKTHVYKELRKRLTEAGIDEEGQDREIRALEFKKRKPAAKTMALLEEIQANDKVMVDLHFHDLRHEGTSMLAEKLAMHELMKVTGHKTGKMVSRYYHPRVSQLALKLD